MELQPHSSRREEMITRTNKRTIVETVQITGFFIHLKEKKVSE